MVQRTPGRPYYYCSRCFASHTGAHEQNFHIKRGTRRKGAQRWEAFPSDAVCVCPSAFLRTGGDWRRRAPLSAGALPCCRLSERVGPVLLVGLG